MSSLKKTLNYYCHESRVIYNHQENIIHFECDPKEHKLSDLLEYITQETLKESNTNQKKYSLHLSIPNDIDLEEESKHTLFSSHFYPFSSTQGYYYTNQNTFKFYSSGGSIHFYDTHDTPLIEVKKTEVCKNLLFLLFCMKTY